MQNEALPTHEAWTLFDDAMWPLRTILWMDQAVWIDHMNLVRQPCSK